METIAVAIIVLALIWMIAIIAWQAVFPMFEKFDEEKDE